MTFGGNSGQGFDTDPSCRRATAPDKSLSGIQAQYFPMDLGDYTGNPGQFGPQHQYGLGQSTWSEAAIQTTDIQKPLGGNMGLRHQSRSWQ